jgi:hypothetical protein
MNARAKKTKAPEEQAQQAKEAQKGMIYGLLTTWVLAR